MKLFVGIDVSSQDMKACVMAVDGETLLSLTVDNNLSGASYLRDRIVDIAQKNLIQEIQIGMEAIWIKLTISMLGLLQIGYDLAACGFQPSCKNNLLPFKG